MRAIANPSRTSLRAYLKMASADQHRQLEERLPIANGAISVSDYESHLKFLLGFHAPVEAHLNHVVGLGEWIPDWRERCKAPLLRDDLQLKTGEPCYESTEAPRPEYPAEAMGVMYVLEGATLGARVLIRRMTDAGTLDDHSSAAYLNAYGTAAPFMWKTFVAYLNEVPEAHHSTVVEWARFTFGSLLAWRQDFERMT